MLNNCYKCAEKEAKEKEALASGTINVKGSIVVRYVFPYIQHMSLFEQKIDLLIKGLTLSLYDLFDKEFMVKKTKVQDGTIIIEFKYPSLLAKEINLI